MSASNSQGEDDFPTPVFTAIRQKPVRSKNQGQNPGCNVVLNPKGCEISIFESNGYKEAFKFDHVLPEDVSQSEVFTRVFDNPRTSFIDLILDGFDLFVIGYGGAGCGKTFTLFGPNSLSEPSEIQSEADHGIMSRFAWRIFENLEHEEMTVKVSSYEIINNEPFDLLVYQDPSPSNRRRSSLCGTIKSDIKVNPAAEIECASAGDVIRNYENARQVLEQFKSVSGSVSDSLGGEATTESSHMFFKIIVEQRNGLSGKKSSVTFVDLASRSTDVGLSSLLHLVRALGGVSNSGIVHYDLSLLTHELKNALGGRALTLVLGCISPENVSETRDTLMFAQTVSNIRNRPKPNIAQVVNEFPNDEEELKYINNSLKFSKPALPPMPMMMPDLINPNPNHVDYMLQMQLQNQIQMQMLNTYMLMHHQNGSQQQQLKQGFMN